MQIISESVNDTLRLGENISACLEGGDIICLFGDLGSGKTVLTKGIARGMGIKKNAVISPSFVLVRQYAGKKLKLCHLDLYRLKKREDILALGYEEYIYGDGVTVIEWADRLGYLLPEQYLEVKLSIRQGAQRIFKFNALGRRHRELLSKLSGKLPIK